MIPPVVIAIGGNALIRLGERGTLAEQAAHVDDCMGRIAKLAAKGWPLVITHGNGPAVGNILIQMECARDTVPPMPLYIADADSEGAIGFLLQQSLYNHLLGHIRGHVHWNQPRLPSGSISDACVLSVVTQVVVDRDDPAFGSPTKPVGPFYTEAEAAILGMERGWTIAGDAGRGWRRVVPSPRPIRVVEAAAIKRLVEGGDIVIAAGGGGVPVVEAADGRLSGVDAVIDKDMASAVLALQLGAKMLVILTSVDCVYLDYGTEFQRRVPRMDACEARAYLDAGQFAPGSMGPKVEAAALFIEGGGSEALVTSPEALADALGHRAGTWVSP
ncbi:MAG: carbamate kinase [Nitrospirae bacterium]|nr:carbamate kinase [Nitrospirota bacterium]